MSFEDTATPLLESLIKALDLSGLDISKDLTQLSQDKLAALAERGDDFLATSPAMETNATQAADLALSRAVNESTETVNLDPVWQAMGQGVWDTVVDRFDGNSDVPLKPKRGGHPGIQSGALLNDIKSAAVQVTKT